MAASEPAASILVVDGDPGVVTGLTRELKHRYGRDYLFLGTLTAQSGLGILERLDAVSRPVALVIAGLRLPDMPGPEFLSRVRTLHPLAKRTILVSFLEFGSSEVLHRAVTLGQADSWLMKPWAAHDPSLYAQVGNLLDEWHEESGWQQFMVVRVVGDGDAPRSRELRDHLERSAVPYRFIPVASVEGRELLRRAGCGADRLPLVVLFDGRVLVQPTNTEVSGVFGVAAQPAARLYDVAVVGAGPGGLSAAVCAASEGLRTVLIERESVGGQAGTSSCIRNYLAFPRGISGRRFTLGARQQVVLFGAQPVRGEATGLRPEGRERVVLIRGRRPAVAGAVVIATGMSYRRLGVPSVEALVGAGVFYGTALTEGPALRGEDVVVVGAGNSAGQAVRHLSRFARQVTLVARGESLAESMSDYLIGELGTLENVTVLVGTQVVDAAGAGRLEQVTLEVAASGARETVPATALFVLIGGEPRTEWLAGVLERDAGGYIRTGRRLASADFAGAGPAPARPPFPFESSLPGVFAAGDVRADSEKKVAAAVGDGSVVIRMVHEYLRGR
ncbi:MAG TPA: FAD-dependent oxidoreductase [Candidatus Dormibacteraeota bacterium]|nr:FAD-dependent oxidoreductase [Candidatus Dormibacteraeota bacterium]